MIKASVIVLIGLLATAVLRRQSASIRHWILACTLACAAITPALEYIVPNWSAPVSLPWLTEPASQSSLVFGESAAPPASASLFGEPARTAASPSFRQLPPLTAIWVAGVVFSLGLLAVGFCRLARIASRATPISSGPWIDAMNQLAGASSRAPVRLLKSEQATLLFTWGLRRPTIILPAGAPDWPTDRIRAVLGHELAHVRRHDWAAQMVAEVVRCVQWFNPFVWLACHRLRQTSEQACDDAVLNAGMDAPEYAAHLLDVARVFQKAGRRSLLPVMTMMRPSSFEKRVRVMLISGIDRSPISRFEGLTTMALLVLLTVPLAGMTARPEAGSPAFTTLSGDFAIAGPSPISSAATDTAAALMPPVAPSPQPAATPARRETAFAPQAGSSAPSSIAITVLDATGRTMPNVIVTIVKRAIVVTPLTTPTGDGRLAVTFSQEPAEQRIQLKTGSDGRADGSGLTAWDYEVECAKPGFKRNVTTVPLKPGQPATLKVVMQIGSLAEMVVIAAPTASGQTSAPTPKRLAEESPRPDPCDSSPSGGCVTPPRKLVDMKPAYPPALAANGVSATVVINATLGLDGFLTDFQPEVGPDTAFVQSVLDALRQWQFSPVRLNGSPQECQVTVTARFVAGHH